MGCLRLLARQNGNQSGPWTAERGKGREIYSRAPRRKYLSESTLLKRRPSAKAAVEHDNSSRFATGRRPKTVDRALRHHDQKGLSIRCEPDLNLYAKSIKVSDAEIATLDMTRDKFHPEFNYSIVPLI